LNEEDVQLVRAAQHGDRGAFGRLVERYKGAVHAAALAIAVDREEAHDLTQETFARALQNLPRLQEPDKFRPWLRGITHTVSQDLRRKAARERRHLEQAAHQRDGAAQAADEALVAREAGGKELAVLSELVSALPENCREALDLRFRENLSYAEIGEVMGVPESTVRGLLYRGTRALRLKMKPMLKKRGQ